MPWGVDDGEPDGGLRILVVAANLGYWTHIAPTFGGLAVPLGSPCRRACRYRLPTLALNNHHHLSPTTSPPPLVVAHYTPSTWACVPIKGSMSGNTQLLAVSCACLSVHTLHPAHFYSVAAQIAAPCCLCCPCKHTLPRCLSQKLRLSFELIETDCGLLC